MPVRGFKWVNDISKMDEDFVKDYDKNDNKGYIFEVDVDYPNKLQNFIVIFHFYLKGWLQIILKS